MIYILTHFLAYVKLANTNNFSFSKIFCIKITPLAANQVKKHTFLVPLVSKLCYKENILLPNQKFLIQKDQTENTHYSLYSTTNHQDYLPLWLVYMVKSTIIETQITSYSQKSLLNLKSRKVSPHCVHLICLNCRVSLARNSMQAQELIFQQIVFTPPISPKFYASPFLLQPRRRCFERIRSQATIRASLSFYSKFQDCQLSWSHWFPVPTLLSLTIVGLWLSVIKL